MSTGTSLSTVLHDERLLWFVMRASGLVLLTVLTLAVAMGAAATLTRARGTVAGLPRFAQQTAHRDVSLLALVLLAVHAATAALHGFVDISWLDTVLPFAGAYQPLWVGLGALSLDLLAVATVVAFLRDRIGPPAWRVVHWVAYLAWAAAAAHSLGIGTDVDRAWALGILVACAAVFAVIVAVRLRAVTAGRGEAAPAAAGGRRR